MMITLQPNSGSNIMNQHFDTDFNQPQTNAGGEQADLSYWSGLSESYEPEWFPLSPVDLSEVSE
jgi:hypothetical protein